MVYIAGGEGKIKHAEKRRFDKKSAGLQFEFSGGCARMTADTYLYIIVRKNRRHVFQLGEICTDSRRHREWHARSVFPVCRIISDPDDPIDILLVFVIVIKALFVLYHQEY